MNIDNVHLDCSAPSSTRSQKKTYRKTVSCKRSCFNRALRLAPSSQGVSKGTSKGVSKTTHGYFLRSRNTTDNPLPKVVQDFQIRLSCTAQPEPVATNDGQLSNSRKRPVFDQPEVEWVSRKARKKESATNSASQPVADDHRWDNIQDINKGFSSLSAGNNDQALEIAEKILTNHAHLSLQDSQSVNVLKARALFNLKRFDDCLQFIGKVEFPLNKGLLMVKGRALQAKNRFPEALPIFKELYINHSKSARDKKVNGMALGRLYEEMGRHQEALTTLKKLRTDLSGHESTPCKDKSIELTLARLYYEMGWHQEVLTILMKLRTDRSGHEDTPCKDKEIELALGRLYQYMGLDQAALTTFKKLRTDRSGHEDIPCNDKVIELALGRQYQYMGLDQAALTTFKKLRTDRSGHEDIPCNDKAIELALGRQYQDMGLHQEALTTFKKLRTDRSGHEGIPCNDKEVELALGRLYQDMGLHQKALTTFKKLRTDRSGHEGTPCNDKNIELTLGRQYQKMGLDQEALTIFKKLRTDRSGHEDTPCNDKEVELALGRLYQDMGLYQKALTVFSKLRADSSGHEGTPCNNMDIELAIGDMHINLMNWQRFDEMQLDDMGFAGPKVDLCISVRYFHECIFSGQDKDISGLLAKAIEHACNAVEKSHYRHAASFSQLGHCLRIAALLPDGKAADILSKDELNNLAATYFTEANRLAPDRLFRFKNEYWRQIEHDFLPSLS